VDVDYDGEIFSVGRIVITKEVIETALLSRLFAAPDQPFVIHLSEGEQDARSYRFSVERKKLKRIVDLIVRNRSGVQR
jgi:hypothetical protein